MPTRLLAIKLEETLAIWQVPAAWPTIARFYIEALETVPADLVERALEHARLNCKWLPKPAELLEPIRESLATRRRIQASYAAKAKALPRERDLTEAERAADRPAIAAALEEIHETLPTREPPPPYRSDAPGAVARRDLLRQAADKFRSGILDGTIPNPIEGMWS